MNDARSPLAHLVDPGPEAVPLQCLTEDGFAAWAAGQSAPLRAWLAATGFEAKPGSHALIPDAQGGLSTVLAGVERRDDPWTYGALPSALPGGTYRLVAEGEPEAARAAAEAAALGWALGCYAFTRYKAPKQPFAELVWPAGAERAEVARMVEAICRVRDLVNTPAEDLGPAELAEAGAALGRAHGAETRVLVGAELLAENYPAIHAVGRAAGRAPRLLDLSWGEQGPLVALVGKGVCFDSGGLDLKPSSGMLTMKKDMGGGAHAIALAGLIMDAGLPVRLRLLVPCVENAVSGNAFRPLDVLPTRKGLTVEVGNTDAEGRLVLCDALAEADAAGPDLILDFATLTGAARVALGPELPALFCNDDATAEALLSHGRRLGDPLWRLPLHQPYKAWLDSRVADLSNVSSGSFAGAVTAALFLERFVSPDRRWAHLDLYAWNAEDRPGRPKGGEAMALRACFALVRELAEKAAAG